MKDECLQEKCQHNKNNPQLKGITKQFIVGLCPVCDACGCESNVVDDDCDNCKICENKEGYIRSGQPKPMFEIGIKHKNDVEIVRELTITEKNKQRIGELDERTG